MLKSIKPIILALTSSAWGGIKQIIRDELVTIVRRIICKNLTNCFSSAFELVKPNTIIATTDAASLTAMISIKDSG
ncbi:MAG: hypothetical protein MZV64_18775 [Ignavibacteriales bacterium]|nr:hypothetical protein [Ignavibacteriales bacterium]